ncbi:MAG: ATP phosphoribosyltransferase regulatory subunit, partial [Pyrinomonadaceae bacterium]
EHAAEIAVGDNPAAKQQGLNSAVLGRLVEFVGANEKGAKGVDELNEVLQYAAASGVAHRVKIDLSLARGLAYYTGTIIEMNVKDLSGSLGGGGRYDNLIGMFSGQEVPACGFSLGLERIIVVMTERNMFPGKLVSASAEVMVLIWYEKDSEEKIEAAEASLRLARSLRASGIRTDLYPLRNVKLGTQMAYASKQGIPFVVFMGDEERSRDEVKVKDLRTGGERLLKREALAEAIKTGLTE